MTDGPELSRRRLLAALTTVGAAGGLVGAGTGAVLGDGEAAPVSLFRGGELVLTADAESETTARLAFDGLRDDGRVHERTLCLSVSSNPAWLWLRACPTSNPVAAALDATLTLAGETFTGTLADVLEAVADGVRVDTAPTQPEEETCLTLAVSLPKDRNGVATEQIRGRTLDLTLQFYAEQARHVDSSVSPWTERCGETPTPTPTPEPPSDQKAISFVAFCSDSGALSADDITLSDFVEKEPGEVVALTWESTEPVSYVVLKAGPEIEYFEYSPPTTGPASVEVGTGTPDSSLSPPRPCPTGSSGVKFEGENLQTVEDANGSDGSDDGHGGGPGNGNGNNGKGGNGGSDDGNGGKSSNGRGPGNGNKGGNGGGR
ncbi:hypothetical protein [Haloprofundus marisrubri]|nr:hypothetical protein [Haloprofundus marisrubri]